MRDFFTQKKILITSAILLVVLAGGYLFHDRIISAVFAPRSTTAELGKTLETPLRSVSESSVSETASDSATVAEPQVMAENLSVPWEVVTLPDGSLLITERPGTLLHLSVSGQNRTTVAGVEHVGEGGLLGIALDPNFETNNWLYLYLTTETETGLRNRIERYTFSATENVLSQREVIIDTIPGAKYHDGGRIAFGPDGFLYVTTGDAQLESLAQDTNSLAGKILRMTASGEPAPDNPFGNYTYSYGHRNPQGLAWDEQGRLWSSEHGPSGAQTGYDEINLITAGSNYGWPEIKGNETREGMTAPLLQSGSEDTWAPGDIAVIGNTLYMTGLRGESLYTAAIVGDATTPTLRNFTAHLRTDLGRLRTVQANPAGQLYLTTSNTDGRGTAGNTDDLLIVLDPRYLQ